MLSIDPFYYEVAAPVDLPAAFGVVSEPDKLFEVYYSRTFFDRDTPVVSNLKHPRCGLYFNLGSQFDCRWPQSDAKRKFYQNHFTLVNLPPHHPEEYVIKDEHKALVINIHPDLLEIYMLQYPFLGELLEAQQEHHAYAFGTYPVFMEESMVTAIEVMLMCGSSQYFGGEKMFIACHNLMIACFDQLLKVSRSVKIDSSALAKHELARQTADYLRKHMKSKVTLEHVADWAGVSSKTLTRLFKAHYKKGVITWLFDERMKHAHHLLCDAGLRISQVAFAVGYAHQTHFTKAFKRKYGYFPKVAKKGVVG